MKELSKKEQLEVILKRKLATGEKLHSQDVIDIMAVFNKPADMKGVINGIAIENDLHSVETIGYHEPRMQIRGIPTISYDVEIKVFNPTPEQLLAAHTMMRNHYNGPQVISIILEE